MMNSLVAEPAIYGAVTTKSSQDRQLQQSQSSHRFNPFRDLAGQARFPLGVLFTLSLVSNLLMLTGSIFMLQVYDRVLASRSVPTLVALTALVAVLYGFYAFIELLRSRMAVRFGGLIDEKLSGRLFAASIRQKLRPHPNLSADPVRDLDSLRNFVSGNGPISLMDLPWMPIYLALAYLLHPTIGWLATGGAVIVTVLLIVNEVHSRGPSQRAMTEAVKRDAWSSTARLNAESIMAMGMMGAVSARWQRSAADLLRTQKNSADRTAFYSSMIKGFRYLLQSAVLALGAYLVIQGELTGGFMIAASILTSRALAPLEQVVAHWRSFVTARQAFTRINATLLHAETRLPGLEIQLPTQSLSVANLASGPGSEQRPVVTGINFELAAGDGLGIIGLSGSGKSTIARAIVGVWPTLFGDVRLDGSELLHYDPERLGKSIGYMPQTVELFDGTVAENIARFQPGNNSAAVLSAARAARIHDLIAAMPDGYDTRIGAQGSVLSGGQRQRIGLARALYDDPFLILLDEPNSNLDAEGDAALTEAMQGARDRGAIVIVVAHRPSAIEAVNKLLFMKDGRQAAFGPKEDVMRQITRKPAYVPDYSRHTQDQDDREAVSA